MFFTFNLIAVAASATNDAMKLLVNALGQVTMSYACPCIHVRPHYAPGMHVKQLGQVPDDPGMTMRGPLDCPHACIHVGPCARLCHLLLVWELTMPLQVRGMRDEARTEIYLRPSFVCRCAS